MSVLAHLAAAMGEPGATQALAYILNKQPSIVQAFVKLLGAAGVTFDPKHRVESERSDDGGRMSGRPDMKVFDAKGNLRVLVENKFWAGTDRRAAGGLFQHASREYAFWPSVYRAQATRRDDLE